MSAIQGLIALKHSGNESSEGTDSQHLYDATAAAAAASSSSSSSSAAATGRS